MVQRNLLISACLCATLFVGATSACAQTTSPIADPAAVLQNDSIPAPRREQAARILVAERTAQSRQTITQALENSADPVGQIAAARAIASGLDPASDYLVPLRLMMGMDRQLTEAAAQALASYKDNPEALRLLTNFASSRQQREADRLIAIRTIGATSYKASAEFLVSLVMREDDTQRIRNAAADALIEMTGQFQNGQEPTRWQKWWEENSKISEEQWRQNLQAYQASRYLEARMQYEQLASELSNILTRAYEAAPPAQQASLLLAFLQSTNPDIRRTGATIIHGQAMAAQPIPQEAREQLRSMISDSSREVRMAVANALVATNDPAAFESLLAQIQREPDPAVRAALAGPIASIGDLRAVPALRKLLNEPSIGTASAGAAALRELGPAIRDKDPELAKEVAADLQAALDRAQAVSGSLPLREAIAEAFIPLREPTVMPTLYKLLQDRNSARIRWAALRALGELRDPKSADTIARYLEDRESGVRLEAVRSLGKTSATEHAEELYRRMSQVEETDATVREEAWNVLQTTFTSMSLEQLPSWIQRFNGDPHRRAVVLRAMLQREDAKKDPALIASANQQMANTLIELNQPLEASTHYRAALDYYSGLPDQEMMVERLTEQYLTALVRARHYSDAVRFSSELLSKRDSYQQTVGVLLRNEVRLLLDQRRPADALRLIEAARSISPALAQRYLDELATLEKQANQNNNSTTAPSPG